MSGHTPPDHIAAVLLAVAKAGDAGCILPEIESRSGITGRSAERILIWLLKYGFIQRM